MYGIRNTRRRAFRPSMETLGLRITPSDAAVDPMMIDLTLSGTISEPAAGSSAGLDLAVMLSQSSTLTTE